MARLIVVLILFASSAAAGAQRPVPGAEIEWHIPAADLRLDRRQIDAYASLRSTFADDWTMTAARVGGAPERCRVSVEVLDRPIGSCGRYAAVATNWSERRHRIIFFPAALLFGIDDLRDTLRHEIVHVFHREFIGATEEEFPRWFREGIAEYVVDSARTFIPRAVAEHTFGRDVRSSEGVPRPGRHRHEIWGYLVFDAILRGLPDAKLIASLSQLIRSPDPVNDIAALGRIEGDDPSSRLMDRARRAWDREFLDGWGDKTFRLEQVRGFPLDDAVAAAIAYLSVYGKTGHAVEIADAVVGRLGTSRVHRDRIRSFVRDLRPLILPERFERFRDFLEEEFPASRSTHPR